jgi:hypothetical protein
MPTLLIHLINEDPVLGEVEALPAVTDVMISIKNPRRRDGKDLHYLEPNVSTIIFPIYRINFVEIMPTGEEEAIVTFVRE